jgi:putative two-component system response regulator
MPVYRESLLFIDDSRAQLQLYKSQMEASYEVSLAATYEEAMARLTAHQPDLIILDMVMPQVNGIEFLDILKGTHSFMRIPVIMVSGENDPNVVRQAFLKGASDFVRKPYDHEELQLRVRRLLDQPHRVVSPQEAAALQFVSARSLMIKALADLAGTRDNETGFHLSRIERYTGILALETAKRKLFPQQITGSFLETIGEISVLHDIGKVGIPDAILKKPGPLTPEEFQVMKTHTTIGAETIRKVQDGFPEYGFLDMAHDIALHHHEKWNGTGYPSGSSGEDIPLSARLVAIVDVFDALTTQRVYKPAIPIDQALEIMSADRDKHFDPVLFDVFLETVPAFRAVHEKLGESAH